eukprot:TRINITY_DN4486_c0_g2_i2.p1 TRINITY_DN4486_c0_g2~~TRINITY_DN4486_c0_g2_i2.p1  ORF type:complete len:569 (+),score=95.16 TRINITY_DN4486_c0_g2_i2:57-1763(+)
MTFFFRVQLPGPFSSSLAAQCSTPRWLLSLLLFSAAAPMHSPNVDPQDHLSESVLLVQKAAAHKDAPSAVPQSVALRKRERQKLQDLQRQALGLQRNLKDAMARVHFLMERKSNRSDVATTPRLSTIAPSVLAPGSVSTVAIAGSTKLQTKSSPTVLPPKSAPIKTVAGSAKFQAKLPPKFSPLKTFAGTATFQGNSGLPPKLAPTKTVAGAAKFQANSGSTVLPPKLAPLKTMVGSAKLPATSGSTVLPPKLAPMKTMAGFAKFQANSGSGVLPPKWAPMKPVAGSAKLQANSGSRVLPPKWAPMKPVAGSAKLQANSGSRSDNMQTAARKLIKVSRLLARRMLMLSHKEKTPRRQGHIEAPFSRRPTKAMRTTAQRAPKHGGGLDEDVALREEAAAADADAEAAIWYEPPTLAHLSPTGDFASSVQSKITTPTVAIPRATSTAAQAVAELTQSRMAPAVASLASPSAVVKQIPALINLTAPPVPRPAARLPPRVFSALQRASGLEALPAGLEAMSTSRRAAQRAPKHDWGLDEDTALREEVAAADADAEAAIRYEPPMVAHSSRQV